MFSRSAEFAAEHADAFGIRFDSVHVVIRGLPDTTVIVKDTTIFFSPDSPDITLDLDVAVQSDGQRFDAGVGYTFGGTVQYYGHGAVQSHAPNTPAPPQPQIIINYHGAGSNVARITVSPKNSTISGAQSLPLSVTAVDSSGASIGTPVVWSTSNAAVASVSSTGVVQAQGRRGTATITASTPTGISDATTIAVILPASSISVVSGSGQTGKAGSALANPAVVQVSASDGAGVAGVNVVFGAPAGGSVGSTSVTTDANGRAQTTLRLGSATGPQSFSATANGFSTAISATATAADPSAIAIVSGNNQADSVHATLAPLSVRVADAFGNPVAGAAVSWTRTVGTGALGAPTSTTGADGVATNTYTLGDAIGPEGVSASITGASAAFSFTTVGGGAATIAVVSGSGQTGRVALPLADPLVVRVNDRGGNPVNHAVVTWTATNGTVAGSTTTDASGQTSAAMTMGTVLGAASATARIANGQTASFSATVQTGLASQMAFATQPTNGTANTVLASVRVALRDAGGNQTAAVNPVTIALGTNPNGATLTGTLTRNAVNGVATFDDLKLDKVGSGYTLTATSGSLASVTSNAFNTSAGAAASMAIVAGNGQSATVNTAVGTAPAVRIVDGANNPIQGVSVTFTPSAGAVVPEGGIVTTNALGVAALTAWNLGTTAGPQSLVASSAGLPSVTINATAGPGNPFKLTLVNKGALQTSITSGATLSPQPSIQLVDQYGNATPAGLMNVTASLTGTGVSLSGGVQVTLGSTTGTASFSNLSIAGAGSTRIAFAEGSGGIKPDTSAAIAVNSIVPTQLLLVPATPASFTFAAGSPPTLPAVKAANDAGIGIAGVPIHIAVTADGVAVGSGDATTGTDGTLSPPGSLIPTIAGAYTVTATSSAISGASVTVTLIVTPAAASKLRFNSSPSITTAGTGFSAAVAITDAFNNVITSATNAVTLALNAPTGVSGAALSGTTSGSAVSGVAAFSGLSVNKAASGYTLTASASGLTSTTSIAFTVNAGAAARLAFSAQPSNVAAGATMSAVKVQVLDANNNLTSSTAPITLGFHGLVDVALNNHGPINAVAGEATFSALSIPTAGTYSLDAATTTGGITGATSTSFTVGSGTVGGLSLVTGPPGHIADDDQFSNGGSGPRIQLVDALGNAVPQAGVTVTAAVVNASGGTFDRSPSTRRPPGPAAAGYPYFSLPAMSVTSQTTNSNGIADFSTAKLNGQIGDFAIRFSVTVGGNTYTVTTSDLHLNHGKAHHFTHLVTLPSVVPLSHKLSTHARFKLFDVDGNVVDGAAVSFSIPTTGGSLGTNSGTTDSNGEVSGPDWTVGAAGTHTLRVTSSDVSSVTLDKSVDAAAPHHIKLSQSTFTGLHNGDAIPSVDATVVDGSGQERAIEDTVFSISTTAHTHQDKVVSIHGNSSSNSHGKSTFSNLVVDAAEQNGATLDFSVDNATSVTGSITFDVAAGTASALDIVGNSSVLGTPGGTLANGPTVSVKDRNKRNGISVSNVQITWTLGTGCSALSFSLAASVTSTVSSTGNNGQATVPNIFIGSLFSGSCTLTASGSGLGSVDFTIHP